MWILAIGKPLLYLWAVCEMIDSVGFVTRVARLAMSSIKNEKGDGELCNVCDDVMGELLKGNDGLSAIPCEAACFHVKGCVNMCEQVQQASATSMEFPCIAAGFCEEMEENEWETAAAVECQGSWFSCKPNRYCHRVRHGLRFTCDLRPGIGRWTGMKTMASKHTVALAEGLLSQKHCGEPEAGPFCIARPTGWGVVAEMLGNGLALIMGGYKSVVAIESPGGGDDRQWLIFWLMLAIVLFVEHALARVLLSTLPFYYQAKLLALIWLIWWEGADYCYRRLKRFIMEQQHLVAPLVSSGILIESSAESELQSLRALGADVVDNFLMHIRQQPKNTTSPKNATSSSPIDSSNPGTTIMTTSTSSSSLFSYESSESDRSVAMINQSGIAGGWEMDTEANKTPEMVAIREVYQVSAFLLSPEGTAQLAQSDQVSQDDMGMLMEQVASVVSFQPRFLNITLLGSVEGDEGELPPMDHTGLSDPYVLCQLYVEGQDGGVGEAYPSSGVRSKICYQTLRPQWQQHLEIPLRGGFLDENGYYHSHSAVKSTKLHLYVRDADVGLWSIVYHVFYVLWVAWLGFAVFMHVYYGLPYSKFLTLDGQHRWLVQHVTTAVVLLGYLVSYVMAEVRRSDDEDIGERVTIPLDILMDQGEHTLLLTLRAPPKTSPEEPARKNSIGAYGIIRIRLSLSEN